MNECLTSVSLNFPQKIYNRFFATYSWAPRFKSLLYPFYKLIFSTNKAVETEEFNLVSHTEEYKMVWYTDNLYISTDDRLTANNNLRTNQLLSSVENCTVIGATSLIIRNGLVSLDIANSSKDVSQLYKKYHLQEELILNVKYDPSSQSIKLPTPRAKQYLHGQWLSILHCSSVNWMHFLGECAPKLVLALERGVDLPFGIIFDEQIPKSAHEVISILSNQRSVVGIPAGVHVNVSNLILPIQKTLTCSGAWPRPGSLETRGFFGFDVEALRLVRNKILQHSLIVPNAVKNIYIQRSSTFRFVTNRNEIESVLKEQQFDMVSTGQMSLQQQVELFSTVNILIAQAGADLANVMFMPKGSTLICLHADSEWSNPDYFKEYANAFEVNVIFIRGPISSPEFYSTSKLLSALHPINANFEIPIDKLVQSLCSVTK